MLKVLTELPTAIYNGITYKVLSGEKKKQPRDLTEHNYGKKQFFFKVSSLTNITKTP